MAESKIDQALIEAVNNSREAVMQPNTIAASGQGKAYQAVAQTAAIAIQDAADALRNISTVATTAAGVALAQYLATGKPQYADVLTETQKVMASATTDFTNIGKAATDILKNFKGI